MPMLGKVGDLIPLVHPRSRLRRGLELLWDCVEGRMPEITEDLAWLPPGETRKFPLEADDLFLLVQCYKPKPRRECRYEAHERHTDLQFIWSGGESIEVLPLRGQSAFPGFDEKGNLYFPLEDHAGSRLVLGAGDVAVLFPQDAHAPSLALEGAADELVRKIVVKVKDAHLADGQAEGGGR